MALFIITVLCFWSCGSDYLYEKEYEIPNETWVYSNQLKYTTTLSDTNKVYNLYLDVTHNKDYEKQNLYVRVYSQFPNGVKIQQLKSLDLSNKLGQWKGDCGGNYCNIRIPIQEGAFFSQVGQHNFMVEQYMRVKEVKGIKSIGLLIEETELKRN